MSQAVAKSNGFGPTRETGSPFGSLLRYYREEAGLSQSALGDRTRFNHAAISKWESGDRLRPKMESIERLIDALDLDPIDANALLAAAGFAPRIPQIRDLSIMLADPRLRESDRDLLLGMVQSITETGYRFATGREKP
jgi:transcriptional regulator with XRE-family HTH domain